MDQKDAADNRAVVVERDKLNQFEREAAIKTGAPVVIMPHSRTDDGRGIYSQSAVFLAKELRAQGIAAEYSDNSDMRVFEVKKSALAEALVTISLGVVSSAS